MGMDVTGECRLFNVHIWYNNGTQPVFHSAVPRDGRSHTSVQSRIEYILERAVWLAWAARELHWERRLQRERRLQHRLLRALRLQHELQRRLQRQRRRRRLQQEQRRLQHLLLCAFGNIHNTGRSVEQHSASERVYARRSCPPRGTVRGSYAMHAGPMDGARARTCCLFSCSLGGLDVRRLVHIGRASSASLGPQRHDLTSARTYEKNTNRRSRRDARARSAS